MDSEPVKTPKDVFVDTVRDLLEGTTTNASHPVQFSDAFMPPGLVGCTVCGAAVSVAEHWKDKHRQNHDDHNDVHSNIKDRALQYVPPPRYG